MIRKSVLTIATAAVISAAAMGATTSTASAGVKVYFGHGWGHGYNHGWGYGHYNPCRRWLRKYNRTGYHRYLRKYRRCMRWSY
ncbi:MAG: hypothetical protein ACR2OM_01590 [Aestuariivirgaceae bacterium]